MSYNFEENILNLSESNNIEKAKLEWKFAFKNIRDDRCGKCICNKTNLKHVYLYRNEITGEWIECGKGCVKKHKLWKLPPNKVLKIIEYFGNRCGWSQPYTPFNHNEYIKNIIVSFKKIVENNDYDKLKDLLDKLNIAISNSTVFNDEKILSVRNDINAKLFEINKKREEARKIQEEALEKERKIREAKWEKERKIREAKWEKERLEWEKGRLEREKKEKKERREQEKKMIIEQQERRRLREARMKKELEQNKKYLEGGQILNFGTKYFDKSYKFVYDTDKEYCEMVKLYILDDDDNIINFKNWLKKKKEEKETITHYFHPLT